MSGRLWEWTVTFNRCGAVPEMEQRGWYAATGTVTARIKRVRSPEGI